MTKETDAMQTRITAWLPRAKKQVEILDTQIETLTGTAKKVTMKRRDDLQHQITVLEQELSASITDAFTENSLGNVEMGGLE